MDWHLGEAANRYHFNVYDFVAAGEINGKQVFPIEFAELGADEFIHICDIRKIKRFEKLC